MFYEVIFVYYFVGFLGKLCRSNDLPGLLLVNFLIFGLAGETRFDSCNNYSSAYFPGGFPNIDHLL